MKWFNQNFCVPLIFFEKKNKTKLGRGQFYIKEIISSLTSLNMAREKKHWIQNSKDMNHSTIKTSNQNLFLKILLQPEEKIIGQDRPFL